MSERRSEAPLSGVRVIEMVGLGPGPFVGMLLADLGAEVIAIDRHHKQEVPALEVDIHRRGKKSIILDLKDADGVEILLKLIGSADVLFEGFRPGVMEKLGLGPEVCISENPKLIYGRMTGWGQDGPLAKAAGHDINYLAITGALHAMGAPSDPPVPPLNLVGDYGGGMFLALGIVAALHHVKVSGQGQVIDAAMVDSVNVLMSLFHSLNASGMWTNSRQANFLDGGAHFYRCYETADNLYVSLGAIERPFMKLFVDITGINPDILAAHFNPDLWPEKTLALTELFKQKTQQQWCDLLSGTDVCFAPVIPFWQAHLHPHNKARGNFVEVDGVVQPAPAPRFSKTPNRRCQAPSTPGGHSQEILQSIGISKAEAEKLLSSGVVN